MEGVEGIQILNAEASRFLSHLTVSIQFFAGVPVQSMHFRQLWDSWIKRISAVMVTVSDIWKMHKLMMMVRVFLYLSYLGKMRSERLC